MRYSCLLAWRLVLSTLSAAREGCAIMATLADGALKASEPIEEELLVAVRQVAEECEHGPFVVRGHRIDRGRRSEWPPCPLQNVQHGSVSSSFVLVVSGYRAKLKRAGVLRTERHAGSGT